MQSKKSSLKKSATPAPASSIAAQSSVASSSGSNILASAAPSPPLEEEDLSGLSTVLKYSILGLICLLGFSIRLFAVVRYESVIHEFDPYFNFRSTKYLVNEGFYNFLNWFDDGSWYPLGRIVGGTIYPGTCLP